MHMCVYNKYIPYLPFYYLNIYLGIKLGIIRQFQNKTLSHLLQLILHFIYGGYSVRFSFSFFANLTCHLILNSLNFA